MLLASALPNIIKSKAFCLSTIYRFFRNLVINLIKKLEVFWVKMQINDFNDFNSILLEVCLSLFQFNLFKQCVCVCERERGKRHPNLSKNKLLGLFKINRIF